VTDYYAVLQVHPDAEPEVIEAAYRQLMRKFHPDLAGDNAARARVLHERAKLINQAYSVLRDPLRRRAYDDTRAPVAVAARHAPSNAEPPAADHPVHAEPTTDAAAPAPAVEAFTIDDPASARGWAPLRALAAAYYLLPGTYEWEAERERELLVTLVMLPVGVTVWAMATGRLDPLAQRFPWAILVPWLIVLLGACVARRHLPRMVLAAAPSLLQVSGVLDGPLRTAHVPAWLAAAALAVVSLIVSARLYVFAVLPTVGLCWVLSQVV
jgi:hypothetical protein